MRDTLQRQLCGADTGEAFGTGLVPLESFSRKPIMVSGGLQAVDTFHVTHSTDGKIDGMSHRDLQDIRDAAREAAIRNGRPGVDR